MNYWVVLFLKPEHIDYNGPLKWKARKDRFDKICDPAITMIQIEDSVYRLDDKKIFWIDNWKGETTDSFVVCEAHKLKSS